MQLRPALGIVWLGLVILSGCIRRDHVSGPEAGAWGLLRLPDSAGVVRGIIDLRGHGGGGQARYASPEVVLGGTAPDGERERLVAVVGAGILGDGRTMVADASDRRLTIFDPAGRRLTAFGRRGDGPGEFQDLTNAWWEDDSTVSAFDLRLSRVTRFRVSGGAVQFIPPTVEVDRWRRVFGGVGGGLLCSTEVKPIAPAESTQVLAPWAPLTCLHPTGVLDTLAIVAAPESYVGPSFGVARSFAAGALAAAGPGRVIVFDPSRDELSWYSSAGSLVQRLKVISRFRKLDAALVGRDRRWRESQVPQYDISGLPARAQALIGGVAAATIQALEKLPYPDSLPLFDRLLVGGPGELWLRRSVVVGDSSSVWVILADDGSPVDEVRLARGEDVVGIGAGRFVVLTTDESDAETAAVRTLSRAP